MSFFAGCANTDGCACVVTRSAQVPAADPMSDTEEHDSTPTPRLLQSFALGVPQGPPSEASSADEQPFVSPPTSPPPQHAASGVSPGALEAAVLRATEAARETWTEEMEEVCCVGCVGCLWRASNPFFPGCFFAF